MLAMKLRPGHGHPAADDFNESRSRQDRAICEVLPPEPDALVNAAAVSRVFVAVAASAAGASAPLAGSWTGQPFVSPAADLLFLAVAGASAVLSPAAQPVFPAAADISGPLSDFPCLLGPDAAASEGPSHGLADALLALHRGAGHRHDLPACKELLPPSLVPL